MWLALIVVGIITSLGMFAGKVILARIRRRYWDLNREIAVIQQQVGQLQQQVAQVQQQVDQLQQQVAQQVAQVQQQVDHIQQHLTLEQLSDLVVWSSNEGLIDTRASQKMLKHIWELKEDNIAGDSPI